MIEEQISKINIKLEDIEKILDSYSSQSWNEHRRGKVGAFYVYSQDQLIEEKRQLREEKRQLREEKRQLREKENLLLAQKASPTGGIQDLNLNVAAMSLSDNKPNIQKTQVSQGPASMYSKGKEYPKGFGYLPTMAYFDPTYYKNDSSLTSLLIPSEQDTENARSLRIYGQSMSFITFSETGSGGISQQFSLSAAENRYAGLKANGQTQFGTKGIKSGIASLESYEDFHIEVNNVICGIFEVKGAEGSLLGAVSQAAVSATNVVMTLLSLGLPKEKCIVPVIGSNGLGIIFGAVIFLDISFPTYIPLSKLLDLSNPKERQIASAYFAKASSHCQRMYKAIPTDRNKLPTNDMPLLLDMNFYFIKKYTAEVYARGLGLFDDNINNFSVGLHHMLEVLNKLYAYEASREVVEFPLSIRTGDKESEDCHEIIYRDLRKLGYKCGAPNRVEDPLLFEAYKKAVFAAVDLIHKAGVIHGDLYVSNIMWKELNDESSLISSVAESRLSDLDSEAAVLYGSSKVFEPVGTSTERVVGIKIIDWDVAHCLEEGKFAPVVLEILKEYLRRHPRFTANNGEPTFGVDLDLCCIDVFNKQVTVENEEYWHKLSSDNKKDMDSGYRSLFFMP